MKKVKEIITVRLDPKTITKIRKDAIKNGYTISGMARLIIERHYKGLFKIFQ